MMVIEPLINNGKALPNITTGNTLYQNDDECCHQIIILVEVGNLVTLMYMVHWTYPISMDLPDLTLWIPSKAEIF